MLTKIIRAIGITLIISFSIISIFIAITAREIDDPQLKKVLSYPSFFEDRFYDVRMRLNINKSAKSEDLVLAAIDNQSLSEIGRWPWPRQRWADVIDKLKVYGAKVIAFDVFFSEPEISCNKMSPDSILAKSIQNFQDIEGNSIILPFSMTTYNKDSFNEIPEELFSNILTTKQAPDANLKVNKISKVVFPIKKLRDAGPSLGNVEAEEDTDGIFRHYKLLANVDGLYFPSFALLAYQKLKSTTGILEIPNQEEAIFKIKDSKINLNFKGETKVRWTGGPSTFEHIGIAKILNSPNDDKLMRKIFAGKAVFIGSTAFGAHDFRHTPIDAQLPGVFLHMNMTQMLLNKYFFKNRDRSALISWILLLSTTIIIIIVQVFGNAIFDLSTMLLLTLGMFFVDANYLTPNGYEVKLFFCLFSVISCYSWNTFLNFYLTTIEKKKIRGTFSHFVSPAIVDKMLENPELVKVGGEKKNITVFFSDVRDFTTISEQLTPEQLSHSLNIYMGKMTDIIFEEFGTLDKYIGDAIVAFWGAPIEISDHAYKAVRAAVKMVDILPEINREIQLYGCPEFKFGIGLNTGDCSVGNMGSDQIFSYTALGDNMNLGARLEGLCKFYGVKIMISEYTKNSIPDDRQNEFIFRELDKVQVKGKANAVVIYEVLDQNHHMYNFKEDLDSYHEAFALYQSQEFLKSKNILEELYLKHPDDKSCLRLKNACIEYIKSPPPSGWDGVTVYKEK